jgi:putative oxidoreductase
MTDHYKPRRERRAAMISFTMLRVAVGALFMAHGWQKLNDAAGTVSAFRQFGVPAPELGTYLAIGCECLGGLGVLLGAFTPYAAVGPILSAVSAILFVNAEHGVFARDGGWEYPLTLLLVCLHIAMRGAGPYSLDARFGLPARPRFQRRHRHVAAQT